LWVVDSPSGEEIVPHVFNITREGALISSFPTSQIAGSARQPQAIAYDAYTGSLWITDRSADRVYNFTTEGQIISSFSTRTGAFANQPLVDPQGITVESSQVLWITERTTGSVYRITKDGSQILSSFPMSSVDAVASNPTGVAFDRPPGDLGAAAEFVLFAQSGSELKMKDVNRFTGVVGDVGLGPNSRQGFDDGLLTGVLAVDPAADNSRGNSVVVEGGTQVRSLSAAAADASYAVLAASVLEPMVSFGEIKDSLVITGGDGLNVIEVEKLDLDNGESLTLSGSADSAFVVNVNGKFKLNHGSALTLAGGVRADRVLVNIRGTEDSSIENGSVAVGTILAPNAKFKIKGTGSILVGTLVGGSEVKLEDGGRLRDLSTNLAAGSLGRADDSAVLGLGGSKVKLSESPTVLGDVVLGPFATQEFGDGVIDGRLVVDPNANNRRLNSVVVSGGTVSESASRQVADAVDGSRAAARLPADQVIPEIKASTTITGTSGLYVVESKKIELDRGKVLTIVGGPDSTFVFNLDEKIKLKEGSAIELVGGVSPENVIFNVLSDKDSSVESGAVMRGTIIALEGKVKVKDAGSTLIGTAISGNEIVIEKAGVLDGR